MGMINPYPVLVQPDEAEIRHAPDQDQSRQRQGETGADFPLHRPQDFFFLARIRLKGVQFRSPHHEVLELLG